MAVGYGIENDIRDAFARTNCGRIYPIRYLTRPSREQPTEETAPEPRGAIE
jgi:hypothetical protein